MFPIVSAQGRVLGFGGRALGDAQPKYLNTADTPVFNKRLGLYALNMAKAERGLARLILVEGYMDVVSLRAAGVPGVVATLGTALTEEQARLAKRYAPEVWVCYDGDAPGQKAILRALDIFEGLDIPCRVIDIPGDMDPDDYVRKFGAEGFLALKPISGVDYRLLRAADGVDMADQEGRTRYAIAACEILRRVKSPVELENHLKALSIRTGFARDVLMSQIGMAASAQAAPTAPRPRTLPRDRAKPQTDLERAEIRLLNLMADHLVDDVKIDVEQVFQTPLHARLAALIVSGESRASVLDRLSDDERSDAAQALQLEVDVDSGAAAQAFAECLATIRRCKLNARITEAQQALRNEIDPEQRAEWLKLLTRLTGELSTTLPGRKE
jgi:DNA primase